MEVQIFVWKRIEPAGIEKILSAKGGTVMHAPLIPARPRLFGTVIAFTILLLLLLPGTVLARSNSGGGGFYQQTNLVSDLHGVAEFTDPHLVNPWGISYAPTSPFWVADNGTGLSTLYKGSGKKVSLVVTIPA